MKNNGSTKIKVGIIGCGTIGSYLAGVLKRDYGKQVLLAAFCDRHTDKARLLNRKLGLRIPAVSQAQLIRGCDLIIEAASAECARDLVRSSRFKGKRLMIMSVGGLLGADRDLERLRGKLFVPSGAIAGIDGLLAARESRLRSVKLITRKPPAGLRAAPYFLKRKFPVLRGRTEKRVFAGNAAQAMIGFPQNVNVGALLSLAGSGRTKTRVEIWTSAAYKRNSHEIRIEHDDGSLRFEIQNKPSKHNPKTSALTLHAAAATLRRMFSDIRLGT